MGNVPYQPWRWQYSSALDSTAGSFHQRLLAGKGDQFREGMSPFDKTLFRQSVPLAKLQINFQHVDKLFACQSTKRCRNIILQDLVDLVADRCRITIGVGGPL